jgi:hypothetical protein
MNRTLVGAVAVLATLSVPMLSSAADPHYTDSNVYQVEQKYPYIVYPSSHQMDDHYPWETTSYPFDPNIYYYWHEQQEIISQERSITGGVLRTDTDGVSILDISQGSIPESSQTNVSPMMEVRPGTGAAPTNATFVKNYHRSEGFGNSLFGASYVIDASITATPATADQAKRVDAYADGKVLATAFSYSKEIVRGRAQIQGQQGGANSGNAALFAMGQQIWSGNLYYEFSTTPINWSRTFFSASKTFMVGPVPITVKASISGGVKLTISGQIGPTVAKLSADPGGWASVTASASVNIIVAKFGVEGYLTLINVTLPSYGELFWPVCSLDWTLRSVLNLNTISGNLKLFAQINFLFFKKKWDVTIATWSGITRNWTLLNINGTQELGICMFTGEPAMTAMQ